MREGQTYSIVYTSHTGNTQKLAQVIKETLCSEGCLYFGPPGDEPAAAAAPLIFAGFWTDKGGCGTEMEHFLKGLQGKRVFLFGTAGFGGSEEYFKQILDRVSTNLDSTNTLSGAYMCQGRMPEAVRERYLEIAANKPGGRRIKEMIDNFDTALSHPDEKDFALLRSAVLKAVSFDA